MMLRVSYAICNISDRLQTLHVCACVCACKPIFGFLLVADNWFSATEFNVCNRSVTGKHQLLLCN